MYDLQTSSQQALDQTQYERIRRLPREKSSSSSPHVWIIEAESIWPLCQSHWLTSRIQTAWQRVWIRQRFRASRSDEVTNCYLYLPARAQGSSPKLPSFNIENEVLKKMCFTWWINRTLYYKNCCIVLPGNTGLSEPPLRYPAFCSLSNGSRSWNGRLNVDEDSFTLISWLKLGYAQRSLPLFNDRQTCIFGCNKENDRSNRRNDGCRVVSIT